MNQYYNPVHSIQGKGSLHKISEVLGEAAPEGGNVLVLGWDDCVAEIKELRELNSAAWKVKFVTFHASNPTVEQLYQVYMETRELAPKVVVAVGGGSVMDVGKTLCMLYGHEITGIDELRTIICEKSYGTPSAKWIGIPTTAGTGSEVTCWATIWDPVKEAKRSVESKENYACAAIVDPDLTENMPVGLAVSSGLDAVAHAVESYWAKGANLVSRALALDAVRLIMEHMDGLLSGEPDAHVFMSQGSMMAGLAFSNTKTTACHSISYPLTMEYGIPHGTAVSMLLAPVLKINQEKTEQMELLFRALGVGNAQELDTRILGILKKAGIPSSLEAWKVPREALPRLASLGITKGRADNNPVDLTPEMIENVLETIYN